jgi:hypothetical protein
MRGLPSNRRVHAKNYIQEESNKRFGEVVVPYQRQGLNALGVDSYEVLLFLKKPSTQVCTCRQIQLETELGGTDTVVTHTGVAETNEIVIDWRRPLFGEPNEARFEEDDGTGLDDYEFDDTTTNPQPNQLLESSADCGICYRFGFVPGFTQYGKHRMLFTTHDLVDQQHYTIDRNSGPHVFQRLHPSGWVEFEFTVPKYFKTVQYSIRNNHELLDNVLTAPTGVFDLNLLNQSRGQKVRARVNAEYFTHLVITFDLGTEPILANIAQLNKVTDWTMFNTIGNLNVILPMTVPELPTGSYIVVPKIGMCLVVTDVTYLRVADQRNLDWSVNTRVSQPQESQLRIHKGERLL